MNGIFFLKLGTVFERNYQNLMVWGYCKAFFYILFITFKARGSQAYFFPQPIQNIYEYCYTLDTVYLVSCIYFLNYAKIFQKVEFEPPPSSLQETPHFFSIHRVIFLFIKIMLWEKHDQNHNIKKMDIALLKENGYRESGNWLVKT